MSELSRENLLQLVTRLRAEFIARANDTADSLQAAAVIPGQLLPLAHALTGTAGTLGLEDVSTLAAAVEEAVGNQEAPDRLSRLVQALVNELRMLESSSSV